MPLRIAGFQLFRLCLQIRDDVFFIFVYACNGDSSASSSSLATIGAAPYRYGPTTIMSAAAASTAMQKTMSG